MSNFRIKTDPEISWVENRNGLRPIKAVDVLVRDKNVLITGVGASGAALRGLLNISHKEMDALCVRWLLERDGNLDAAILIVPQDSWNLLYETLQMDSDSAAFDPGLRKEIRGALSQVNEFISGVGN